MEHPVSILYHIILYIIVSALYQHYSMLPSHVACCTLILFVPFNYLQRANTPSVVALFCQPSNWLLAFWK